MLYNSEAGRPHRAHAVSQGVLERSVLKMFLTSKHTTFLHVFLDVSCWNQEELAYSLYCHMETEGACPLCIEEEKEGKGNEREARRKIPSFSMEKHLTLRTKFVA